MSVNVGFLVAIIRALKEELLCERMINCFIKPLRRF